MIRLLVKLGLWLDKRFPEKRVVTEADYDSLWKAIKTLETSSVGFNAYQAQNRQIEALEAKLAVVERAAVHKDAVKDVIVTVQKIRDDVASFKTSLGFNRMSNPELSAMLNGDVIGVQDDNQ